MFATRFDFVVGLWYNRLQQKGTQMPKRPIWLDDYEMEILRGFLGELLDETENGELPDFAREVIHNAYEQTLEGE